MKKHLKKFWVSFFLLSIIMASSCRLSTNQLAEEVKKSMKETWKQQGITGVAIDNLTLTHKGGNEYSGLLETTENGEKGKYTVEVIYDGENMKWELEQ